MFDSADGSFKHVNSTYLFCLVGHYSFHKYKVPKLTKVKPHIQQDRECGTAVQYQGRGQYTISSPLVLRLFGEKYRDPLRIKQIITVNSVIFLCVQRRTSATKTLFHCFLAISQKKGEGVGKKQESVVQGNWTRIQTGLFDHQHYHLLAR